MNDLEQLSTLDPMRDYEPSPERRARATAALERLFLEPAPAPPRRPAARRLALSGAALAAVAAVAVAGVQLVPGENGNRAYGWTPTPRALAGADVLPQAGRCADGWGADWKTPPIAADVVLAEQRGQATLLLVRKDGSALTACYDLGAASGAAGGDLLDTEGPAPAPGRVRTESMGATEGSEGWYSSMIGRAGIGVQRVEIELPDGTKARASLRDGWWAAWWPGAEGGRADGVRIIVHGATGSQSFKPSEL